VVNDGAAAAKARGSYLAALRGAQKLHGMRCSIRRHSASASCLSAQLPKAKHARLPLRNAQHRNAVHG